nr:MAG TPA: tail tape measure protein [Caudoviricetes sp.]
MPNNETTTKFTADLSQLKKEFQEAQRHIALVNSEFKASTAGMGKWSESADGLGAKIKQLNGVLEAEESKLQSLESQYALVVKEQGENSKGAQELMIKINNQKAAVENARSSIGYYTDKLAEMSQEAEESKSATEQLSDTVKQQESDLEALKAKYADLVLEQGKSSKEAKATAKEIQDLSSELQQNKTALDNAEGAADKFDKTLDDMDDSVGQVGDGFTVMKGALADLVADGIKSGISALKDFATQADSAHKSFQAATGASTEEMEEFSAEMDDLYKNNYGESLEDIGDKMAYVKQVTGEVDPSKIRELTENAIALEDTFGSDFNETVRGVNNLMEHFGISSEEAFDLFAKGSQEGLDYTGELGDNIAEYGGNFKQAGYSAEDYFQLLKNGSKSGAYNLDKVNDSINEVKNRLGDGTIGKNINMFSENTKTAFKNWESGKGTMKDVIDSIVKDINNCTNEQDALNMAATAFGTMGEDANLKVVKSLKSTGTEFTNVQGKMEEIKKIKYDDVKSQFAQLGRTVQMDVIAPLAEKALPTVKEFVKWGTEHLNEIVPIAEGVGVAIGGIFAVNKAAEFTGSIGTLAKAFGALTTDTTGAESATNLFGGALTNLPALAVTSAIAGLAAGVYYLTTKYNESIESEYGLTKAQQENIDKAAELKKSYDELAQARVEATNGVTSEYDYIQGLKGEYNSLINSNGKVKKGYEDRANFILTQLADSLGLERKEIDKLIEKNGQLGDSIDQIIQKKQAEATLSANESAYTEAVQKRTEALDVYQTQLSTVKDAEEKYKTAQEAAAKVMETYQEYIKKYPENADAYLASQVKILDGEEEAKKAYDEAKAGLKDAEDAYVGYNTTISNYEGLSSAIISGDTAKIKTALVNMQQNFVTAETGTKNSLVQQVTNMRENYKNMQTAIENGTPGVTQAMVDQAKEMVDKAEAELDKLEPKAGEAGKAAGTANAGGLAATQSLLDQTAKQLADAANKGLASKDTKKTGSDEGADFNTGLGSTQSLLDQTAKQLSDAANKGLGTADTKKTGTTKGTEYKDGVASTEEANKGIGAKVASATNTGLLSVDGSPAGKTMGGDFKDGVSSKSGAAETAGGNVAGSAESGLGSKSAKDEGENLSGSFKDGVADIKTYGTGEDRAESARDGLKSVKTYDTGNNFTAGFKNGMGNGSASKSIWSTAWDLGKKALGALKKSIKEGSPSKITYQSGSFFVQGFANAISDGVKTVVPKVKKMGEAAIQTLNAKMATGINAPAVNALSSSVSASKQTGQRAAAGQSQVVNNTYNFNQTNNSPKSLSRLEIYRQTKNQLQFAKGV